ncbi:MAG: hypothetical protein HUJ72_04790 [Blautia sp.]|nr:hypothetical protein [Blautia sp.]
MKRTTIAKVMGFMIAMTSIAQPGITAIAEESTNAAEQPVMEQPLGTNGEQPPQMPDGQPPKMPDDQSPQMPDGQPPQKPDGAPEGMNGMEPPAKPDGEMQGGPGGPGGMMQGVESYDSVITYSENAETTGESYVSEGKDENAVHIDSGAEVKIKDAAVTRISAESTGGDTSSFYGVGAAVLATDGTVHVDGSTIETNAGGGAGVFAYGNGTVYVTDTQIHTEKGTSGGIHVAGGGTLYAKNTTAETQGESSAAIRSDRGGGKMIVDGGSYTSNGTGSPAIYSTADIAVHGADLTAAGSEAICIEGKNSIHLFDCNLSGNMADIEQNDCTWNVILYQSMSGDSEVGNSIFDMQGGTLTANNGGMFYTTNTESTFILSDVDITCAEENDFFLKCTGNANKRGWGQTGNNGADCSFTAIKQQMQGNVIWDSVSMLDLYMKEGSTLTGAFIQDESCAGEGGSGYADLYISADSQWIVTGDSVVRSLYSEGTITDAEGNIVTIQKPDGTILVEGDSEYRITVQTYETAADFSGAGIGAEWSSYELDNL